MLRIYTSYVLSLLSAFMVYWMFGVLATVAAGLTWLSFSAFVASVLHFGVSSWLFLSLPKAGRGLGVATAMLVCSWPVSALVAYGWEGEFANLHFFLLPVLLGGVVVYNHITTFSQPHRPALVPRVILSIIPAGFLLAYIIYLVQL